MTNIGTTDNTQIDRTEIEKVTNFKYLRQTTAMEDRTTQEVSIKNKSRIEWVFLESTGNSFRTCTFL